MIASPLTDRPARYGYDDPPGRPGGTRAGRSAVQRRRARTRRNRYAALRRIMALIALLVLIVTIYLGLMANITRMNYELATLDRQRDVLRDETELNDDAIASAESDERLKAFADRLHMHEPQSITAISLPPDRLPPAPSGVALLGWLK
jgi:hypothetical protein